LFGINAPGRWIGQICKVLDQIEFNAVTGIAEAFPEGGNKP
tara:strand:- start:29 stop:151 length:123 start_codon:yes stop_codon:yes gene_type:complete